MGKVKVFTGQAGTGKTFSLMQSLSQIIPEREWLKFETILALTFMHGSRKRLETNLKFVKTDFKVRYECSTIDSFALTMLNWFRSYIGISKIIRPNEEVVSENEFEHFMSLEMVREKTVHLLQFDSVRRFIENSYPYIVIDEFQDCTGTLLEIVKQLSNSTNILIASDQFQQLSNPESKEGMQWIIESQFEHKNLNESGVKRTNNNKILVSATCLRTGVRTEGSKIKIFPCPGGKKGSFPLAEYHLKANIYYTLACGNIAIISPTQNSPFVSRLLESLSIPYTYKKAPFKTIGPYNQLLGFENSVDIDELVKDLPRSPFTKKALKELKTKNQFILNKCVDRLNKRLSLRGIDTISYDDFYYVLKQTAHTYDNFYKKENTAKLIFTTVHGAKNREFDNVIVLWPYNVTSNLMQKRKLLYNAITRAKQNAVVIIQYKSDKVADLANDDLFGLIIDEINNQ
ncbi:MAG: ATP-dependent helicase [Leadbetterella sp.]|nr:ATP-dependent helicase [Leadbetterella sp.]